MLQGMSKQRIDVSTRALCRPIHGVNIPRFRFGATSAPPNPSEDRREGSGGVRPDREHPPPQGGHLVGQGGLLIGRAVLRVGWAMLLVGHAGFLVGQGGLLVWWGGSLVQVAGAGHRLVVGRRERTVKGSVQRFPPVNSVGGELSVSNPTVIRLSCKPN